MDQLKDYLHCVRCLPDYSFLRLLKDTARHAETRESSQLIALRVNLNTALYLTVLYFLQMQPMKGDKCEYYCE